MRQFKIKNLLIQILPEGLTGLTPLAVGCDMGGCSLDITPKCDACSGKPSGACVNPTDKPPPKFPDGEMGPADLAVLKARLELALQEVEVRERIFEERLKVRTIDEA